MYSKSVLLCVVKTICKSSSFDIFFMKSNNLNCAAGCNVASISSINKIPPL